jgi:DNA polymerase-3 subunit gamma/tau
VRDALSLFDQAIAHASGPVRAEEVRQMLGLADRTRVIDLFDALMRGDIARALGELRDQYDSGADPAVVLNDLAEFTHFVTRTKIVPSVAEDRSLAEVERMRGREFAAAMSMRVLSRAWQMLLKGLPEVQTAGKPIAAAEMVLVRIAYAADLPTPDEAIRAFSQAASSAGSEPRHRGMSSEPAASGRFASRSESAPLRSSGPVPTAATAAAPMREPAGAVAQPATVAAIGDFEDLVALAGERRDLQLKAALERDVRLVRIEDGKLEIALEPTAPKALAGDLARKLNDLTGRRWMVVVSAEPGQPTVKAQQDARRADIVRGAQADPLVQSVLACFPGAQIVAVRQREEDTASDTLPPGDADEGTPEPMIEDETPAFGAHSRPDDVDDDF